MEISHEIEIVLEKQFENANREKVKKEASMLSKRYCEEKREGQNFIASSDTALAYAIIRMPATYTAVKSVLQEGELRTGGMRDVKNILDLGAGTGAATLALKEQFPEAKITCLEREKAMINLGKQFQKHFAIQEIEWKQQDLLKESIPDGYDLILESYLCNEWKEEEAQRLFQQMLEKSKQFVICLEPGTPESYQRMLKLRQIGIEKGFHLIAPCPHENPCPLVEDWCHSLCRVQRSKLHRMFKQGELAYEDEKFTYYIFSKTSYAPTEGRILRHPIVEKNFVKVSLCTKEGLLEKKITKKEKEEYKAIKKKKWGDGI